MQIQVSLKIELATTASLEQMEKQIQEAGQQAMREAFKFKVTFKFVLTTLALVVGGTVAASAPANWL